MRSDLVTFVFFILLNLLLVLVAQVEGQPDNLMEVDEEQDEKDFVLPQNKLRKNEKRLDAINLRKKIIAEIYKRDSSLERTRKEKKERQQEKKRKAPENIHRKGSNQKRRRRPFINLPEPKMGDSHQNIQSDETEKETEDEDEGIHENHFKTQKHKTEVHEVDIVQQKQSTTILPPPNESRSLTLQTSLLETSTDGGKLDEKSPDEQILQTMSSGREALWRKLLERRPVQADLDNNEQQTRGYGRERFSQHGSTSQTLIGSDEMVAFNNESVIPNLDQQLSASQTWEQSVLKGGWPTRFENKIERSEVGEEEVDNSEGALGLRLTTAAPPLLEDELLIKVFLRLFS